MWNEIAFSVELILKDKTLYGRLFSSTLLENDSFVHKVSQ